MALPPLLVHAGSFGLNTTVLATDLFIGGVEGVPEGYLPELKGSTPLLFVAK